MKRQFLISFISLFFSLNGSLFSQVRIDFTQRTSLASPSRPIYSINGDFTMIGNTNMSLLDYGEDLMNDGMMVFVDVDSDPDTFNSSSATFNYSGENGAHPSCTRVLFAGLYWSGRGPSNLVFNVNNNGVSKQFDKRKVKFKGPGQQNYIELEASDDEIRYPESLHTDLGLFVGFKDVTALVHEWGEGEYTVADIGLIEGTNYHYGGWGMVVVYENPAMDKRDVSVFDGYAFVRGQGAASYDIPVSGFSASGNGDVNIKLGMMAGEGDVGADGDYFAIESGAGTDNFERLSHGNNDNNNFFNSSIYTDGNPRNPNLKNNTGMDISVFKINNQGNGIIGNNQTSTRFRYGSTWDVYVIYNITMAIDANDVEVEIFHEILSVNGIEVNDVFPRISPGDELELVTTVKNKGQLSVNRSSIEIPLPWGLSFSGAEPQLHFDENFNGEFNFIPENGPAGTIVWEIGDLPVPENSEEVLGTFKYTLRFSEICEELLVICYGELEIDGKFLGENSLTQTVLDPIPFITGFNLSEECFDQPIRGPLVFDLAINDFIKENCGWHEEGLIIPVCVVEGDRVMVSSFSGFFPEGTAFYFTLSDDPGEQGGIAGQYVTLDNDELNLYALYSPLSECYQEFKLVRNDLTVNPMVVIGGSCDQVDDNEIGVAVSGGIAPYTYLWDDPASATTPTLSGVEPGEYNVTVTDASGCSVDILVLMPDIPAFSMELLEGESNLELGCTQGANGLVVIVVEGGSLPFILNIVRENSNETTFSEEMVITKSGQHEISDLLGGIYSLTLTDLTGCQISQSIEVNQMEESDLQATFTYSSDSYKDSGVLFQNSEIQFSGEAGSGQGLNYLWDFGNGQGSTQKNPSIRYGENGQFLVNLTVEDENGCQAIYQEFIEITRFFIRVPTAFSPDGESPNDYFFPVFSQLKNIRFWVFNRWGELLFFTGDINSKGWDGKHKGKEMPVGSYLYKLIYTDFKEVENQKVGSFSLVK